MSDYLDLSMLPNISGAQFLQLQTKDPKNSYVFKNTDYVLGTVLGTLYGNLCNPYYNYITLLLFPPFFKCTERLYNLPAVTPLAYLFSVAAL